MFLGKDQKICLHQDRMYTAGVEAEEEVVVVVVQEPSF